MSVSAAAPALFDDVAETYDATFSASLLGRLLRRAVHDEIGDRFVAGDKILDLGCGTGEDAVHFASRGIRVHGIDVSERMVLQARAKVGPEWGDFTVGDLAKGSLPGGPFDGAIANFGVLNCLRDRRAFGIRLHAALRPGARVFFIVMGRRCLSEWMLHLLRLELASASRRRGGQALFRGTRIYYPTPGELNADFEPSFRRVRTVGIGIMLPPSEAASIIERHPRIASALDAIDRRIRAWPLAAQLSDHFLIELERL